MKPLIFIEAKYTKPKDYLLNIQQDILIPYTTVHDEVDIGVEDYLLQPLLKKVIDKFTAKKIIDSFKMPYLNFLYDTEFSNTGSWSGEGYEGVDGFSPYEYPRTRKEALAREKFLYAVGALEEEIKKSDSVTTIEEFTTTLEVLKKCGITSEKLKKYAVKKNGVLLKIKKDGKILNYSSLVSRKLIKKLTK
jgi:hypothetical protein